MPITLPVPTDESVETVLAVDGDHGAGRPVDDRRPAQCASVRMTFVRMIDSLMENWRSISLTSTGLAFIVMTA